MPRARQEQLLAPASISPVDASTSALLACACVPEKKTDNVAIYLRVPPRTKTAWARACEGMKVDQSTAGVSSSAPAAFHLPSQDPHISGRPRHRHLTACRPRGIC